MASNARDFEEGRRRPGQHHRPSDRRTCRMVCQGSLTMSALLRAPRRYGGSHAAALQAHTRQRTSRSSGGQGAARHSPRPAVNAVAAPPHLARSASSDRSGSEDCGGSLVDSSARLRRRDRGAAGRQVGRHAAMPGVASGTAPPLPSSAHRSHSTRCLHASTSLARPTPRTPPNSLKPCCGPQRTVRMLYTCEATLWERTAALQRGLRDSPAAAPAAPARPTRECSSRPAPAAPAAAAAAPARPCCRWPKTPRYARPQSPTGTARRRCG